MVFSAAYTHAQLRTNVFYVVLVLYYVESTVRNTVRIIRKKITQC